ncbi:hypothetical protein COT72_03700 [archaeon CG10_big_fil_rev_8_21_14_0_10_43_11]|nr:MAG: hypothetical protein COT72_03700 [archaeon CG10_big_fil_rev_8_21_14_0_10_43_11]
MALFGPKYSVIIPVLNETHERIMSCIDAIVKARSKVEVIVVDGGSENPPRIPKAKVILCESPKNQLEEGVRAARGDVVCTIHADTLVPVNYFDAIDSALKAGVDYGVCTLDYDVSGFGARVASFLANQLHAWFRFSWGDDAFFVRKNVLKEVDYANADVLVWNVYVSRKLAKKKYTFSKLDCHVVTSARRFQRVGFFRFARWVLVLSIPAFFGMKRSLMVQTYKKL